MRDSIEVTAANGRTFTVIYLPAGAGPKTRLSPADQPRVEFYDLTGGQRIALDPQQAQHLDAAHLDHLANVGHFTGGRYYVATLLGEDPWSRRDYAEDRGLSLMGSEPEWTIDGDTMRGVRVWLRRRRAMEARCDECRAPIGCECEPGCTAEYAATNAAADAAHV